MTAWEPAVRARALAGDWRAWAGAEIALLLGGWIYWKAFWGGMFLALSAPVFLMGLILFYGMAVLSKNALQVAGLGAGMGILFVFLNAMGEGIGSDEALLTFLSPLILLGLCRLIHVYVSPIWTAAQPD